LTQKPVAELLDDNRLVVWEIEQSRKIYNSGFYGKPLGDPRPSVDFDTPLLLDPVEALYLAEHKIIKIRKEKQSISSKKFKKIAEKTFKEFNEKYRVYSDLRDKGYVATPGIKYGSDFAVYESGPGIDHAPYIVQIIGSEDKLTAAEIVKAGRLASTVRKSFVLAIVNDYIRYIEFNWWKA
jgi:tRNA-intron endonuclease